MVGARHPVYDAIVIGARCAGAATAMLLARGGARVLLVDRARLPSDIPHGHFIHQHGPRRLAAWGLLDRVLATGCPPVTSTTLGFDDIVVSGSDLIVDGVPMGLGPRRAALDAVLVEAAVEAGAELRTGFAVHDLEFEGDRVVGVRGPTIEHAGLVVGADGRNSGVARRVDAPAHESAPTLSCWYFSYWSGVPANGLEIHVRDERAVFAFPTNDDLFALFVAFPIAELPRVRADIEGSMLAVVAKVPGLAERVAGGRRVERLYGATQLPNFLRRPFGAGWALVGDAGCHKDPFLALGVCDAFRDAELLAGAVLGGDGLASYAQRRDAATLPGYRENLQMARLQPPEPRQAALLGALRDGDGSDANRFFLAREGMVEPETFFNDANLQRVLAS
jgi:flavin-dependent dehydrogenase